MTKTTDIDLTGSVCLAIGWRSGSEIQVGRIEISQELAEKFREIAKQHTSLLERRVARDFAPDVDLVSAEEYLVVNRSELDSDEPITSLLASVELRDPIAARQLPKSSLLFYAIVFPGKASFLRKSNSHQSARTGKIFSRLGETLDRVTDPIFAFDSNIDLVILENQILVSSPTAFDQLFRGEEFLTRHIPIWVETISKRLRLTPGSEDVLITSCLSQVRLRRRLESIYREDIFTQVDMKLVRSEAKRQGLDPKKLFQQDKLDFTQLPVDDILKLLNEDLMIGKFSDKKYAVDKKIAR